jgi:deazaflavin-dependent oxidoreductase (nitroreductase family)
MDRAPSTLVVTPYLRVQQAIYRASRGWVGRRLTGAPSLLLTTVGRKSGRRRTRALIYYKDAATWVVVASNGGSDRGPGWLANLAAEPQVVVQDGRRKWPARARVAAPEERARLWPLVNRNNRGLAYLLHRGARGRYDVYQRRTARQIPIVILERTEENLPQAS